MRKAAWLVAILTIICLSPVFLFASIEIPTFSLDFYAAEYQKQDTAHRLGMTTGELLKVTRHMQNYMKGKNDELNIETVVNGERRLFFSDIEIYHMKDVKNLFIAGNITRIVCFVLFLIGAAAVLMINRDNWKMLLKSAVVVPMIFLGTAGLLALLVSLNFDSAFTIFHEIFFTNDLWILDPSKDLLVNIVPQEFFVDIAIRIIVIFISMTAGMSALSAAALYIAKKTLNTERKGRL